MFDILPLLAFTASVVDGQVLPLDGFYGLDRLALRAIVVSPLLVFSERPGKATRGVITQ